MTTGTPAFERITTAMDAWGESGAPGLVIRDNIRDNGGPDRELADLG